MNREDQVAQEKLRVLEYIDSKMPKKPPKRSKEPPNPFWRNDDKAEPAQGLSLEKMDALYKSAIRDYQKHVIDSLDTSSAIIEALRGAGIVEDESEAKQIVKAKKDRQRRGVKTLGEFLDL